jgi:hypothetical protein
LSSRLLHAGFPGSLCLFSENPELDILSHIFTKKSSRQKNVNQWICQNWPQNQFSTFSTIAPFTSCGKRGPRYACILCARAERYAGVIPKKTGVIHLQKRQIENSGSAGPNHARALKNSAARLLPLSVCGIF